MSTQKTLLRILSVIVLFVGFAGYSYLNAAGVWTAPTGNPPTNNVDTPITVSIDDQIKEGGLSVKSLATAGGNIGIVSNRPMQKFISTNLTDPINVWYQFTESNSVSNQPTMAFAYDRDGNGRYGNDYPVPLVLRVGTVPTDDRAQFAGKVQSNQSWSGKYCNQDGSRCMSIEQIIAGLNNSGPVCHTEYTSVSYCDNQSAVSCPAGYSQTGIGGGSNSGACGTENLSSRYQTIIYCSISICS